MDKRGEGCKLTTLMDEGWFEIHFIQHRMHCLKSA